MDAQTADFDAITAAYRLLGVPHDSSPLRIKRAYREFAKTWHPDKFPPGTHHHEYAAERMRDVNNAFETIRHAPLRYQFETVRTGDWIHQREEERRKQFTDRSEYIIRIAAGAIVGLLFAFSVILQGIPVPVALVIPIITAAAAAIWGDTFWRWVLKLWWLWTP